MKYYVIAALILLSGCATQVATTNIPNIESSNSLKITDMRPEKEKEGEIFSVSVSNDAYATYRVSDSSVAPPATRIFQHRAFEKFNKNDTNIKLHHFVVYRNHQAEYRRSSLITAMGMVGEAISGDPIVSRDGVATSLVDQNSFTSTADTEFKRALYSEKENPGRGSIHIVYIETEINGKRVFSRTLTPIKKDSTKDPLVYAIEEASRFHLSQYN